MNQTFLVEHLFHPIRIVRTIICNQPTGGPDKGTHYHANYNSHLCPPSVHGSVRQ